MKNEVTGLSAANFLTAFILSSFSSKPFITLPDEVIMKGPKVVNRTGVTNSVNSTFVLFRQLKIISSILKLIITL